MNRRQFVIMSGLTGLGAIGLGQMAWSQRDSKSQIMALPGKSLLRFGVLADTGSGSMQQYAVGRTMLQQHKERAVSMVLLAGDNIYNGGEFSKIRSNFSLPYYDLLKGGVKFYACLGNHDARADVCGTQKGESCAATSIEPIRNEQVNYSEFNMRGQRYYTFTQGNIQFFATETNSLNNPNSPTRAAQLKWLDQELGKSKAKLKIVFGHHAIYSVGQYGNNETLVRDLSPILEKHKVPLWIDGHDHNYQRSNPIKGVTYLISGGGGASLYPIEGQADWSAFAKSVYSCAVVDVYSNQLIITGLDSTGAIIDRGTIKI
jgi:Calcineurin-like phosphoesterase